MCARVRVNCENNFDEKLKFSILSLEILGEPLDHPTELFLGTSKISLLELLSNNHSLDTSEAGSGTHTKNYWTIDYTIP